MYRILKYKNKLGGCKFRVQKKHLFWWTVKRAVSSYDGDYYEIVEFPSLEKANQYIINDKAEIKHLSLARFEFDSYMPVECDE